MARFVVERMLKSGRVERMECIASSESELARIAQDEGWTLLKATPVGGRRWQLRTKRAPSLNLLSHELKTLLSAGLSLPEVLAALAEREANHQLKVALQDLHLNVNQGHSLSDAMLRHPRIFPPLYVATIKSGERTGDLPRVIERYLQYSEQMDELKRKLLSAITYPAMLLIVGGAVVLFLLTYLVPRFSVIYEQVGSNLSAPAALLLAWGVWCKQNPLLLVAALVVIAGGIVLAARSREVRAAITSRLQSSVLIGPYWASFNTSRYCRSLALLTGGGIALPNAMQLAGGLLPTASQPAVQRAVASVQRGRSLSDALNDAGLLTPIAVRLIKAGEKSGEVSNMLSQAANFHDRELAHVLERVGKLIEPALMLFIGLVIGSVVVLMYLPIFELAGSLRT